MILKSFSLGARAAVTIILFTILLVGSFLLWIMEAPRSLPLLNRYFEHSFNSLGDEYTISIEKTLLLWDTEKKKFDIRSINMRLFSTSKKMIASFPEGSIGFDASSLLNGSFAPSTIEILSPVIRFHTPKVSLSLPEIQALYKQNWEKITSLISAHRALPFKTVTLKKARLIIDTPSDSMLWYITEATATIKRTQKIPELLVKGSFDLAGEETKFTSSLIIQKDKSATATVSVDNLPVHKLLALIPFSPHAYKLIHNNNTHLVLTGNISVLTDTVGNLHSADFTIDDAYGKFFHPTYMEAPLYPRSFKAQGHVTARGDVITIDNGSVRFPHDTEALFSLSYHNPFSSSPELQLSATVENFPVNELGKFWPLAFASKAREWVTSRISGGLVSKAVGKFVFKPEYFINKSFPPNSINAQVYFSGAQLDYFSPLPLIHHINGVAAFTNDHIAITSDSALMQNTQIRNAQVMVPYIDVVGKKVTVEGTAKGSASDLLAFLPLKTLANNGILLNLNSLTGNAQTNIQLAIPYKHPLTLDDIDITLQSTLDTINVPNIIPHINASGGKILATIASKKMTLAGNILLNDTPSSFESVISLKPKKYFASQSVIHTSLFPKDMDFLKDSDSPMLHEGKVATTIRIINENKTTSLTADMNATDAILVWDKFGLRKNSGEKALLSLNAVLGGNALISIPHFSYSSNSLNVRGKALLEKDLSLQKLDLNQITAPNTNLTLHYKKLNETNRIITIKGSSLDLRTINFNHLIRKTERKSRFLLSIVMDRLLMKNNEVFTHLKGNLTCDEIRCISASLSTTVRTEDTLSLLLTPKDGQQKLVVYASNASAIARALNISQNIRGGTLEINAVTINPPGTANRFQGLLSMKKFVTINNPILSQLIAVVSLPGIGLMNMLKGNGIFFDRLEAPFVLSKEGVTLTNARVSGPVLGITINGNINIQQPMLHINGTVMPTVYGINSLLSKVPLVGKTLMGGKNQGIIAANYTVSGPPDKTTITVNPFSLLAPGFLRKMFD